MKKRNVLQNFIIGLITLIITGLRFDKVVFDEAACSVPFKSETIRNRTSETKFENECIIETTSVKIEVAKGENIKNQRDHSRVKLHIFLVFLIMALISLRVRQLWNLYSEVLGVYIFPAMLSVLFMQKSDGRKRIQNFIYQK